MRDVQTLQELLERCERASGPDREIECRLFASLHYGSSYEEMVGVVPNLGQWACPAYTSSLDASIALVERMFDGAIWGVTIPANWSGRKRKPKFEAHVTNNNEIGTKGHIFALADGKTAPLAILSALLRALISQSEGEVA